MKRLTRKQKFWAMLGAGLLAAAVSGSALARQIEERAVQHLEVRQEQRSTIFASPLATPTVQPAPEPENDVEFTGVVEVMASDMWVVGGRTVAVTTATEIKPGLEIGVLAKVHAIQQTDGSLLAREIEAVGNDDHINSNFNVNDDANDNGNINSNDDGDHGNVNSNDDNGNDDHSNSNVNSNDDGNDDHANGNANSNDDHGDDNHGGNGNDHNGNDDHGGHGNGD